MRVAAAAEPFPTVVAMVEDSVVFLYPGCVILGCCGVLLVGLPAGTEAVRGTCCLRLCK